MMIIAPLYQIGRTTYYVIATGRDSQCLRENRQLVALWLTQILVEHHCDVANENSSEDRHFNSLIGEPDQVILCQRSQSLELRAKVLVKIDTKLCFYFTLYYHAMAEDAINYTAPKLVFRT